MGAITQSTGLACSVLGSSDQSDPAKDKRITHIVMTIRPCKAHAKVITGESLAGRVVVMYCCAGILSCLS